MIGPTTREPLMTVLLSAIAPDKSSGLTSEGNIADHAGALSAFPIPTPKAAAKSAQIGGLPSARVANATEKESCTTCIETSHFLRSKRSAMTPAGMDKKSSGPSWAKMSKPTTDALPVRWYT